MVVICYVLADWHTEPAVKFLTGRAAQRTWPARPPAEVSKIVEDTFAEAFDADPEYVIQSLCNTDAPHDEAAMRQALFCLKRVLKLETRLVMAKHVLLPAKHVL